RRVVATSAATARLLAAEFAVPPQRLTVVRPGTDPVPQQRQDHGGPVALLSVGSVVPRKGYDVLIGALGKLADLSWRLVIVGDRERSAETARALDAQVARLGLADRVTVTGAIAP